MSELIKQNSTISRLVSRVTHTFSVRHALKTACVGCVLMSSQSLAFKNTAETAHTLNSFTTNGLDTRLCLISDMNGPYGSIEQPSGVHAAVSRLTNMNCDIVVGAGDLVAGQDTTLSTERLRAMWSEWERVVAEPFLNRGIPLLSALGNHDASAERRSAGGFVFQRERDAAAELWTSLSQHPTLSKVDWQSRDQFPFYYSLKFKSVGIIVFDGTAAGEVSRNRLWLEQQLEKLASDSQITTRIVVGHLPLFAVAKGRETVGNILFDSVELYSLFNKYGVDFYLSGHHHAFYPGRVQSLAKEYGTVQLALGAIGDGPRRLLSASALAPRHSMTLLDILNSIAPTTNFNFGRFNLRTLSPFTGEIQPVDQLPERLESFDGRGRPVDLRRFDF